MKKLLNLIVFLALACSAGAQSGTHTSAEEDQKKVTVFKLENGLTVYLNEDHTRPEIFGGIAVKAGSKYDPADATGLAHYLEHMCFKGTQELGTINYAAEKPLLEEITALYDQLALTKEEEARKKIQKQINEISVKAAEYAVPNEMDRLLESIGSKGVNAFTSFEMVVYHNSFPAHQAEKWLDLYAHRFEEPVFRLFQPELEVVYEEKNRMSDNFGAKLIETYLQNFFKEHPYGTQTTIGATEHLKNPPLRKMQEYYNTYFVANNMALVLTGDFDTKKMIPMVQQKFARWHSGTVPVFPTYTEKPFNGRELVEVKLTPVKMELLGYRTVAKGHEDEIKLRVCNYLLNNSNETGLLDELTMNGDILGAFVTPFSLEDAGANVFIIIPKLLGQSLDDAETLVKNKVGKLKKGEFDDKLFTAAKNNLKADFYRSLEDGRQRALYMVDAFIGNREWSELMAFTDKIDALKREDILAVANKYYGDNYLVLQSKMGFPKKDKLEKPGFEPVKPKEGVKSEYAKKFERMPSATPKANFVDFKADLKQLRLNDHEQLFVTANPVNDLFTVKIKYAVNSNGLPLLPTAADIFNYTGADTFSSRSLKIKMSELGCNYRFYMDGGELALEISGLEENADKAIKLVQSILKSPKMEEDKLKLIRSQEKANRKLETGDPNAAMELIKEYMIYGDRSAYLTRPSLKELSKLTTAQLAATMKQAMAYPLSIHYVGRKNHIAVRDIFIAHSFSSISMGEAPKQAMAKRTMKIYAEPTLFVLNRKDARQSHLWFYSAAGRISHDSVPLAQAFNSYFGGDMSSLVFQEIREFRSLAYSARFRYVIADEPAKTDHLMGYIGCQGDKTQEALATMMDLIKNMPAKPERTGNIKTGLRDEAYSERPFFRDLSEQVQQWEEQGYSTDPNKLNVNKYEGLEFNDISNFYKKRIQVLPVSLAIVGNKDNLPKNKLKAMGKVIEMKEKNLRKK